jgi:hypothetical protein
MPKGPLVLHLKLEPKPLKVSHAPHAALLISAWVIGLIFWLPARQKGLTTPRTFCVFVSVCCYDGSFKCTPQGFGSSQTRVNDLMRGPTP